jgi:hypothetical protein
MKCYRFQLVRVTSIQPNDKAKRYKIHWHIFNKISAENTLLCKLAFSDEAIFHLTGQMIEHTVTIWGTELPHNAIKCVRNSAMINGFCALSTTKIYGTFFFRWTNSYWRYAILKFLFYFFNRFMFDGCLDMLENWLMPQLGFPARWGASPFSPPCKAFPEHNFAWKMDWTWINGVAPKIAGPDTLRLFVWNSPRIESVCDQCLPPELNMLLNLSVSKCCKMCGWNWNTDLMCVELPVVRVWKTWVIPCHVTKCKVAAEFLILMKLGLFIGCYDINKIANYCAQ